MSAHKASYLAWIEPTAVNLLKRWLMKLGFYRLNILTNYL
jgi:hypothetical protein